MHNDLDDFLNKPTPDSNDSKGYYITFQLTIRFIIAIVILAGLYFLT